MLNILVEYWLTDEDEHVPRATSDLRPASAAVYRPPSAGTLAALQVGSCCNSEYFGSDRKDSEPLPIVQSAPGLRAVRTSDALVSDSTSQMSMTFADTCHNKRLICWPSTE